MGSASQNGNSAEFSQARLFVTDFDGAAFDTFEPPVGGVGVDEAYRIAIGEVFGGLALARYDEEGGHKNRTPTEIAQSLSPDTSGRGLKSNARQLVDVKLDILLEQIGLPTTGGKPWPQPIRGFEAFWSGVSMARKDGTPLSTGVLSAGHTEFIERCFESAGLEMPDFMYTHETAEGLYANVPVENLAKPSPVPMEIITSLWLSKLFANAQEAAQLSRSQIKDRILYSGDDVYRDRKLAENADVDFVHIPAINPENGWEVAALRLHLGSLAIEGAEQ
ncbi:MAG TPA: hypothetical protein VHB72_00335 [Candidatus Saccharimonadales bacterium]|nr:hypothetical protein [Candidatus Saccharimonadales bacterium]